MAVFKRNNRGGLTLRENIGLTPEELYYSPDEKNTDEEVSPTEYVGYPEVKKKLNEMMDLSDSKTREYLLSLDEASQNTVLTNLTSKLYDHIVKKTTDIDYGTIPSTKGDITKLDVYDDLKDVLGILKGILKEYHENGGPVDVCTECLTNLETRKDIFNRAYHADCQLPILIYENTVLALVSGVSYLIAACIEFIKAPRDETYSIQLDKIAYAKSKDYRLYSSLEKFNKSCSNGDMDKAINEVIAHRVKKFAGITAGAIAAAAVGIIIIMNIIPILRELVFLLYYTRTQISDFFEIQAELLQMNAYNVEANKSLDSSDRKEIARKQRDIADKFLSISNFVRIDAKQSDVKASRELESNKKKYKVDEVINQDIDDDPSVSTSSLF